MRTPEFAEKIAQGPVVIMTVLPNQQFAMGANFVMWFLFSAVVSLFSGYIAGRALPPGANYLDVFRFVGTPAFMGYALAAWPISIWYKRAWSLAFKGTIDGLIYALLTAGTFGWLWPK